MSTVYFFTECLDCGSEHRARDWEARRAWTVEHKDTTGHLSFEEDDATIVGDPPRPFLPITDCPGCSTVTAHTMNYRAADTNPVLIEVTRLDSADSEYIANGRLEPVVERECLTCERKWDEELPDEWRQLVASEEAAR